MKKLSLKGQETRKTLKLVLADHLQPIHKDKFLECSPQDTLRSITFGKLTCYYLDDSTSITSVQNSAFSYRNLGDCETLGPKLAEVSLEDMKDPKPMNDLCDETGLESLPCFMNLPTDLKLKIIESLPAASIGIMACVCTEMRYLVSLFDNDFWEHKFLKKMIVFGSLPPDFPFRCRLLTK